MPLLLRQVGQALIFFQDVRESEAVPGVLAGHPLVLDEPAVGLGLGFSAGAWVVDRHVEAVGNLGPGGDGRSEHGVVRCDLAELGGERLDVRTGGRVGAAQLEPAPAQRLAGMQLGP